MHNMRSLFEEDGMIYNYDFFVSYAHEDNKNGFVTKFVERLENNTNFIQLFGSKPRVFFDKEAIDGMDNWKSKILTGIDSSRFLIVLISPDYFQSENCAREFERWLEREMHRCFSDEGIAPIQIAKVPNLFSGKININEKAQKHCPRWISVLRERQSPDDFNLLEHTTAKIDQVLTALYHDCREKVWRQNSASKSPHNAFYPNYNKNFVGRRDTLLKMQEDLTNNRRVALYGLSGVGKTELALMYGHSFAWNYRLGRVYIHCENQTSLFSAILSSGIDHMINVELQGNKKERLSKLFSELGQRRAPILNENEQKRDIDCGAQLLLILDNVNKIEILNERDLAKLPDYVHVVTTTQENPANFAHLHGRMSVDSLSDSEALELLRTLRPFDNDDERQAAKEIIKLFGGHAFRVEKIGAYLRQNRWEKYRNFLKKAQQRINERERLNYLEETIDADDFQLRHERIRDEECLRPTLKKLTRKAMKLLDWAALFGPDSVVVPWLGELAKIDGDDLGKSLQELEDYRLLIPVEADSKEQTTGLFNAKLARLHRIAREVVRNEIDTETRLSMFAQIGEKIDELLTKDDWWHDAAILDRDSIADLCYDHYLELKNQGPSEYNPHLIRRLNDLCRGLSSDRRREIGQASIELGQRWVDDEPDNPQALKALGVPLIILGSFLEWEDEYEQARESYEKAVEIWKKALEHNPDDSDALIYLGKSYDNLGVLLRREDSKQAREYREKAVENFEKARKHTPDDSDVLYRLSNSYESLGDLAKSVNDYERAKDYYEKRLEILKEALERKPDDYYTLRGLSDSYESLGHLAKSVNNYEQARKHFEKRLGVWKKAHERKPDDSDVLRRLDESYESLGDLAKWAKNYEQAKDYYEKRLEVWKEALEREPDDYHALSRLSYSYDKLGELAKWADNYDQAREYFEKRLEVWKEALERNPDDSGVLSGLSYSYESLGELAKWANEYEQAREYFEKRLELWKEAHEREPDGYNVLYGLSDSYESLADLSKEQGDLEQGKKYEEKAAEISAQIDAL